TAHQREVEAEMPRGEVDAPASAKQHDELADDRGAAAEIGGSRCTGDAQLRKRTEPEDEARAKHDVQDVSEPEDAHRDRGITSSAEHRVQHEEEEDGRVAAEHH